VLFAASTSNAAESAGDAKRGAKAFQACVACHSLERDRHMTGPSLAQLFGRKAGTHKRFLRYSDAMLQSGIVWNERTLDQWLASPVQLIPGNDMAFPGIPDSGARRDLITYLKAVSDGSEAPRGPAAGPRMPRLKSAQADDVVKAIRYCGDTYFATTEAGKTHKLWEFNLRLKTDSTEFGPHPGRPVLVGVGMGGDRAALVFSAPGEIAKLIKTEC
jgi:cytochrome c